MTRQRALSCLANFFAGGFDLQVISIQRSSKHWHTHRRAVKYVGLRPCDNSESIKIHCQGRRIHQFAGSSSNILCICIRSS